mmetsp:Transcript_72834/g.200997  ORF Transcript_72834/g.200997 Transcript_72834/m.200997 type:complete len:418 (+) Transcript_72834:74-1327(+)
MGVKELELEAVQEHAQSDREELMESASSLSGSESVSRPSSPSSPTAAARRAWGAGTLLVTAAALVAAAVLAVRAVQPVAASESADHTVVLGDTGGCCSWNHVDCGHGGTYCQKGPGPCKKCNGVWGHFQDSCTWGHPPAPPLPEVWRYHGKTDLKVKVMSYNLEWWATGGGQAAQVIKGSSKSMPYDFMGFQECNDPWHVLWMGGLQHEYEAWHVNRGAAVDICITWRNASWQKLGSGVKQVATDKWPSKYGARYAMWARFQHVKTKEIVFFMNHHGPLPLNSGGASGGPNTASALLGLVTAEAKPDDAIILVGDFNADGGSLTVRQLECKMSHVAWGDKYNGVDNVFANVEFSSIDHGHGKTLYGGNSDHNALNVVIDLAHKGYGKDGEQRSTKEKKRSKKDEKESKEAEESSMSI